MDATIYELPAKKLMRQLTLRVTGLKGLGVRLWIARQLFALGAHIAGVNIVHVGVDRD